MILGDGWIRNNVTAGAHVFAVDRLSGNLLWLTKVHEHIAAIVTSLARRAQRRGVRRHLLQGGRPGCFRRATSAARFAAQSWRSTSATGRILWKTYTVPSNNGGGDINLPGFYSGNGVWGSSPVVDTQRGLLYVGTANNFSAPPGVCLTPEETGCKRIRGPDNHFDAIVALTVERRRDCLVETNSLPTCSPLSASVVRTSTSARPPTCSRRRTRPPAARVRSLASARRAATTAGAQPRRRHGCLAHEGRSRRTRRRRRVRYGHRRQSHLRGGGQQQSIALHVERERSICRHDRHQRLLVGAEFGNRRDPLADAIFSGVEKTRVRHGGKRRRLCGIGSGFGRKHDALDARTGGPMEV